MVLTHVNQQLTHSAFHLVIMGLQLDIWHSKHQYNVFKRFADPLIQYKSDKTDSLKHAI